MTVNAALDQSSATRVRRVIVFADVVESVRLMQEYEGTFIDQWRTFVAHVRTGILPEHRGRLVRTAGDGLLIEFQHIHDAVAAAFSMHDAVGHRALGPQADVSLQLRIGMHLADVVFDENEAYGVGVNLAARLAGLAQPTCTVISAKAREGLIDGLHAFVSDMGLRYLKHVKEPVRAFGVAPKGSLMLRASTHIAGTPEDLRPTIAVVPFSAMPNDPAHDALGHAIADDVIAALSRHPELRVLSRATTGRLQDTELDIKVLSKLRQLLDATFLLTGRYYVMGTAVRLKVELCSLPSGEVHWSGDGKADINALFAGEDALVPHIVNNVCQRVVASELARVRSLPMDTLPSYTLYLGAVGLMNSLVPGDFMRARDVMDHLVERHPRQAAAHALVARWHVFKAVQGWTTDVQQDSVAAAEFARRAIDIDHRQAIALSVLALVNLNFEGNAQKARVNNELAIEADPSEPHAWAQLSAVHCFTGDHVQAMQAASRALSISPLDPNTYLFESYAAMAALSGQQHALAVRHARTSLRHHALHAPSHRLLVGCLWLDGQHEEARLAATTYLQHCPGDSLKRQRQHNNHIQLPWRMRFTDALRQAGVPA